MPLIVLLVAFAGWQWSAAVRDVAQTSGDRSTEASFYAPLNGFLAGAKGEPFRVEIPFTFSHWETAEVSPRFDLARGWLRPDDRDYNHLFYDGTLDAGTYAHGSPITPSASWRSRAGSSPTTAPGRSSG